MQRFPRMSPCTARPLLRIQHDEVDASATKIIGRCKARLPCTDDHDIRRQELRHDVFSVRHLGRVRAGQRTAAQVGDRIGIQITVGHVEGFDRILETGDHGRRQLAGDRVVAERAGVDVKKLHGSHLRFVGWAAVLPTEQTIGCCQSGIKVVECHVLF
mgnify:CR=1 FL=1